MTQYNLKASHLCFSLQLKITSRGKGNNQISILIHFCKARKKPLLGELNGAYFFINCYSVIYPWKKALLNNFTMWCAVVFSNSTYWYPNSISEIWLDINRKIWPWDVFENVSLSYNFKFKPSGCQKMVNYYKMLFINKFYMKYPIPMFFNPFLAFYYLGKRHVYIKLWQSPYLKSKDL